MNLVKEVINVCPVLATLRTKSPGRLLGAAMVQTNVDRLQSDIGVNSNVPPLEAIQSGDADRSSNGRQIYGS